jgi:colanic acid/amylovoran biosynthesis protein
VNVVISNTTLLNTGDAAIVEATVAVLRRSFIGDMRVVCYDANPLAAADYRSGLATRQAIFDQVARWGGSGLRRKAALIWVLVAARLMRAGRFARMIPLPAALTHALTEYHAADVVISAGGTYLVPNYRLAPRIYDFLVTLALGRPLVLFTQSLGPFPPGRDRLLLRFVLRRVRLILVRDGQSAHHLAGLGVSPSRIAECADAAFGLAPEALDTKPRRRNTPPRIAVSVRDWPFIDGKDGAGTMERYLDAVATFVTWIVENEQATVVFISSCQGVPDYWTDDSQTARRVVDRLPSHVGRNVTVDSAFRSPTELIERLRPFDAVIATRMHVAILALCAGVPVIPIAYEFKTRELARRLGLCDVLQDIAQVSAASLLAAWRLLRRNRAALEMDLQRRVVLARQSAMESGRLAMMATLREAQ